MPPKFEPTDEQRKLVKTLSGFGIPQVDIATHLEIDPTTLRRHFRRELDRGMIEANVKVAQSLFQLATQGKNVAAAIFWMKARAQWREKHEGEHGYGQVAVISRVPRAEDLTDDELARIIAEGNDGRNGSGRGSSAGRRSYVVGDAREMTPEEWNERFGPKEP
jgi:hypothetical protein